MNNVKTSLRKKGSITVELGIVLWLLFLLIFFPLLNLTTICLRSYFFSRAVHDATINAARTSSFAAPVDGEPCATSIASQVLAERQRVASGTKLASMTLSILQTEIKTAKVTRVGTKLAMPADTNKYQYQLELQAVADISPFIPMGSTSFGKIPGLTSPFKAYFVDRQFVEYPQGLHL